MAVAGQLLHGWFDIPISREDVAACYEVDSRRTIQRQQIVLGDQQMITPNPIFCIFLYLSQFKFK
jgi:hypothetical protein